MQIDTRGLDSVGVAALSRGGNVLLFASSNADPQGLANRWVYDLRTGTTRDAPGALGVNDAGLTVGMRAAGKDLLGQCDDSEVFIRHPDGTTEGLGNPVHGDYGTLGCFDRGGSGVELIDEQGRPVVRWRSTSISNPGGVFRWNGSSWVMLPPVGAFISGPSGVNDRGDLAGGGGSSQGGTVQHAAIWRDGKTTEIGTFGGTASYARAINDAGQVVGWATTAAGVEQPFVWADGKLQALPLPAGYGTGEAYGIANDGTVAGLGIAAGQRFFGFHAMLWTGGQSFDLNDLIDDHRFLVTSIAGMTRDGRIVAYAWDARMKWRPVLLVPRGPAAPDRSWRGGGVVLADGQNAVSLAVDANNLYWRAAAWNGAPSLLQSMHKGGGAVATLGTASASLEAPILDGTSLWLSLDDVISRMPVTGGTPTRVAPGSGQFAVQSGLVFSKARDGSRGAIYRTPVAGGVSQVIDTTERSYPLSFVPEGIAANDSTVFYTVIDSRGGVTIRAQPLQGGPPRDLFPPESRFTFGGRMVLDAAFVYLSTRNEIVRVRAGGGAVEQVVGPLPQNAFISDFDVKDGQVFWTLAAGFDGPGCLSRANVDGSGATALECGLWDYAAVRVDGKAIYAIRDVQVVRFDR